MATKAAPLDSDAVSLRSLPGAAGRSQHLAVNRSTASVPGHGSTVVFNRAEGQSARGGKQKALKDR